MYAETFGECKLVKPVPRIVVDLSSSPDERWRDALRQCNRSGLDCAEMIAETRRRVDDDVLQYFPVDIRSSTDSAIGRALRRAMFYILALFSRLLFTYWEDLEALAELLHMPVGELFLANILYEILGGCTSFVCAHKEDICGRPLLSRTLDWPFLELAKYTVQFEWVKGGDVVFESVGWMGYVGVMTGCKPGAFAIALNARYPDTKPYLVAQWTSKIFLKLTSVDPADDEYEHYVALCITGILNRLLSAPSGGAGGAWISGSIIRAVLQAPGSTFESAVALLSRKRLLVPCYFIIAGCNPGEGAVATRDMAVDADPSRSVRRLTAEQPFLVQTNSDFSELLEVAGGKPPEDFNSVERHDVCAAELCGRFDACGMGLSGAEAALILTTSLKRGCGVRMKMTLYFSVMVAHHKGGSCIVSSRPSRPVGP